MSERCQCYDGFKQCRATKNLTGVTIEVNNGPFTAIACNRITFKLCPRHFVIEKATTHE